MNKISLKWKLAQKLEYKWWERYLKKKNPTEYLQQKIVYWKKVLDSIKDFVSVQPNDSILDAGCGPAGIFLAFPQHRVDAIDPLIDKYTNLSVFNQESFPWTSFKNIPIEELSEKEKYNVVFCLNAINHVNDLDLCCKNLVDALKPDGKLIVSTDAHRSKWLKKIFQWLPGDMLHPIQLDIDEYAHFLAKHQVKLLEKILFKRVFIFDYYILIAQKESKI